MRADVWKYLLGVLRAEKSDELQLQRNMQSEYIEGVSQIHDDDEVARRVRGEVKRLRRKEENRMRVGGSEDSVKSQIDVQVYVRIISIYLSATRGSISYHPPMVCHASSPLHARRRDLFVESGVVFSATNSRLEKGRG